MIVYTGAAGGSFARGQLKRYGIGRAVAATGWHNPIAGVRWFFDNGAWHAYARGLAFDEAAFWRFVFDEEWCGPGKLERASHGVQWPDFGVVPDIVMGGKRSLSFSSRWNERLPRIFRWLLAVQDGMPESDVADEWDWAIEEGVPYSGIFVGGSLDFKWDTTPAWRRFVDNRLEAGILHIGRVSSLKRLVWAERVGATSVDSTAFALSRSYSRVEAARFQSRLPAFA